MIYSYSQMDRYRRCPLSYKRKYIENIPDRSNKRSYLGSIVHSYMEYRFRMNHIQAQGVMLEKYKDFDIVISTSELLRDVITDTYFKNTLEVEYSLEFKIGKYNIMGIIDRLDFSDGMYEIIDYKYGRYHYSMNDLNSSLQLQMYAWGLMQLKNVDVVKITYMNLSYGDSVSKILRKSDIRIDLIEKQIDSIEKDTINMNFPAKPSSQCFFCSVSENCPSHIKNQAEELGKEVDDIINYYKIIQEKEKYYKYQRKTIEPYMRDLKDMNYPNIYETREGDIIVK